MLFTAKQDPGDRGWSANRGRGDVPGAVRSTGEYVYSGCYTTRLLPGNRQPSVHVAFPLQAGNVQVFLRPRAEPDGALLLSSPPGPFGDHGAYVVVEDRGGIHAARAPIHETLRVYVDGEGVLRTDHSLCLWSATVVRLHYKLIPGVTGPST